MNLNQKRNVTQLHSDIIAIAANPKIASEFNYCNFTRCFVGLAVEYGSFGNREKYGVYESDYRDFMKNNFGDEIARAILWDNDTLRRKSIGAIGLNRSIPILEQYMKEHNIPLSTDAYDTSFDDLRELLQNQNAKVKSETDAALSASLDVITAIEEWRQAHHKAVEAIAKFKELASASATPELYSHVLNKIPSLSAKARAVPKRKVK